VVANGIILFRAKKELDSHTVECRDWSDFCTQLEKRNIILAPFCGSIPCEDYIKQESAR
jgi:bifunctional glutamyl/prolyl-tRNA synthetase